MNGAHAKTSTRELLEEAHPALVGLSHWIHANPEMGFQEALASAWVTEWLTTAGFAVEAGVAGMPTAVIGRTGPGPFHVAVCVEYDALPEVGHACGHNVIAAASVGAGLALASVADELALRVTVIGTPAEETGGGKLRLIDAGAFDGAHMAMMVHPWPKDVSTPSIIAVNQLEVTYTGREAHAAGFPHRGINAADAMVIAQTAIGLLRQQLLPTDRVHGIVTHGGDAPNVIPANTTALFMVRAQDLVRLTEVVELVRRCFEAGALATGAEVSVVEGTAYAEMRHDAELAALYRVNAEGLGRVFDDTPGAPVSTDMGDVSQIVPSIHPMIGIETHGAVNHQKAFADACATPSADQAIFDGALAMAWTVIDAVQDMQLRGRLMGEAVGLEAVVLAEEAIEVHDEVDTALEAEALAVGLDVEIVVELEAEAEAAGLELETAVDARTDREAEDVTEPASAPRLQAEDAAAGMGTMAADSGLDADSRLDAEAGRAAEAATGDDHVEPAAAAAVPRFGADHADWEQQFLAVASHTSWEDRFTATVGDLDVAAEAGDVPWYSGAPEIDASGETDDDAEEPATTPIEWIPAEIGDRR